MQTTDSNVIQFKQVFDKVQSFSYDHYALSKQKYYEAFYFYLNIFENFTNEALKTGKHSFAPFTARIFPKKNKGFRVFLESSLLDRLITFSLIKDIGITIQNEIDDLINEKTMPIPPAASFLHINNPYPYTDWQNDYFLWQQVPEYYGHKGYSWHLQTDLHNFFDTIDTNILLSLIQNYLKDEKAYKLIKEYFDVSVYWNGSIHCRPNGLPTNEPTSHLFANLYLLAFDKWVINQNIPYVRYVDDMRFFAHSREECENILKKISEHLLVVYNLKVNPDKVRFAKIDHEPNEKKAEKLFGKIIRLQKESRGLPYRNFIRYENLSAESLHIKVKELKENASDTHNEKQIPGNFGSENSGNNQLNEYARFSAKNVDTDEFEKTLYDFLDWILAQSPASYITSLLRITVSKLSFINEIKTAHKVSYLLKSESYAWRLVAAKAILKTHDNNLLSQLENHVLSLLLSKDLPIKEIKHILALMHDRNAITANLIQQVKATGNKDLIKHIIPAINTVDDLIMQMKQSSDFEFLEAAAIQIYKLRIPDPLVFDFWKNSLTQTYLPPDLKACILIWAEFLYNEYDLKAFIYDQMDHFTRFELSLFKESLLIGEKKAELSRNNDGADHDATQYTNEIIDRIENSFHENDDEDEPYLF